MGAPKCVCSDRRSGRLGSRHADVSLLQRMGVSIGRFGTADGPLDGLEG